MGEGFSPGPGGRGFPGPAAPDPAKKAESSECETQTFAERCEAEVAIKEWVWAQGPAPNPLVVGWRADGGGWGCFRAQTTSSPLNIGRQRV